MKSGTKRIISTLAICGALILEAGATAFSSIGKGLAHKVDAADATLLTGGSFVGDYPSGQTWVGTDKDFYSGNGYKFDSNETLTSPSFTAQSSVDLKIMFGYNGNADSTFTIDGLNSSGTVVASTDNLVPTQAYNNQKDYATSSLTSSSKDIVKVRINFSKTSNYGMKEFYVYAAATPVTTYQVTYKANGGTGSDIVHNVSAFEDCSFTAPSGKVFDSWNTSADGNGTKYEVGAAVTANTTVYAIWKSSSSGETGKSEGTFTSNATTSGIWTATGGSKGSSYYKLVKDAYIYNTTALTDIDCSKSIAITLNMRTVGGTSYKNIKITAYSNAAMTTAISAEQTISATNGATLADATLDFKFNNGVSCDTVFFKFLSGSGSTSNGPGVATLKLEYTKVASKTVESIAIKTAPTKTTTYYEGETFNPAGLVITATYDDKTTADIAYAGNEGDFTFDPSLETALSTSNTSVKITYKEKTATQAITVNADELTSITLGGSVTGAINSDYDLSGVTATGAYKSGRTGVVLTGFTPTTTASKPTAAGTYDVSVSVTIDGVTGDKTYSVTVKKNGKDINDPYTVDEAKAAIDSGTDITGVYVTGKVCKIDSFNESYGSITYWISADGTNSNSFEVYGGLGLNGEKFKSIADIYIGLTVVIQGNLKKYGTTYEADVNSKIVSWDKPYVTGISVKKSQSKTSYNVGDNFDPTGLVITATYSDLETKDVTYTAGDTNFSFSTVSSEGKVTITYCEKTCVQTVTILVIANITGVASHPDTVGLGKSISVSDVVLNAVYNDGSTTTVTPDSIEVDTSSEGTKEATATYNAATGTKTATFEIDVVKEPESATINISKVASDNGWENGKYYHNFISDIFSFEGKGTSTTQDNGYYASSSNQWRFYKGTDATITIEIAKGGVLVSAIASNGMSFVVESDGSSATLDLSSVTGRQDLTSFTIKYYPPKGVESVTIANKPVNDKLYYYGEFADEHQFSATVLPEDAVDKSVTWSITSGDTLASIDQTGKVTLTGAGEGQVTIQAQAGEKTDTYTFSVVLDTVSSIAVKTAPGKTSYYKGETINLSGLVITATMASGQTHDIAYSATSGITCTQEKAGISDESITISYQGKTTTTAISVHEPYVTSISANTTAISIGYGTDLKDSTLVITATYEDSTSAPVTDYEIDENFDNTDYSNPQDVEITFGGQTVTIKVTVLEPKINSLDVVETYVEVPYGEDLKNYITVKITTEDDATPREYSGYDISLDFDNTDKSQTQDVRISAGEGVYDNLNVKIVNSVTVETINSVNGPTTVDYGTSISASDFTVNVTYTDGLSGTITPTSIDGYDPEVVGAQSVTLYNGDAVLSTETVTVKASEVIDHLEIISGKEEVAYGGTLTTDDFTVKAVYTDGHYDEEASHPDSIAGFDGSIRGTQTVTLTYKGVTVDSEVKVLDSTVVASATVTSYPDNLTYGSTLSYTDIVLSVTYTDGRTVNNLNPDSISGYTGEPGENTIHYVIGNYEDDIKVTVLPSTVIGSITASTEKTEVAYGGTFTAADVSVTYVYTDGHTLAGQAAESISGFDATTVGSQTITVTAAGKETTITVTVLPSTVVDSITASTEKTEVAYGGTFTAADVSVTYVYTDGHTLAGQAAESVSGFDATTVGSQTVTVTAAGKETTITVTVLPSTVIDSITASTEKTEVAYDGEFTAADVSVTYVYTDGHTLTGQAAESISGFDAKAVGSQTVTVNAAGKETTITVTVLPSTVIESIAASTEKTEVEYGGTFTKDDVSVVATYTDGHTGSIDCESISGFDGNVVGAQTVTVNAGGKETTITVTVKASEVIDHIEVSTEKSVVDYGGTFTKEDVSVTYVYTDGHTVEGQPAESISEFNPTQIGEQEITVTAAGKTTTITVTVNGHVVLSLDVTGYDEYVDQGKDFVFNGTVTAHYADGTTEDVTASAEVSKLDTSGYGSQTAKVSFGGVSVDITINVIQTKTPIDAVQGVAIGGGCVVGVAILAVGLYYLLKMFKI